MGPKINCQSSLHWVELCNPAEPQAMAVLGAYKIRCSLPRSDRHTSGGGCNKTLSTRFIMASLQQLQPLGQLLQPAEGPGGANGFLKAGVRLFGNSGSFSHNLV